MKPVMDMKFNRLLDFPQASVSDEDKPKLLAELDALGGKQQDGAIGRGGHPAAAGCPPLGFPES